MPVTNFLYWFRHSWWVNFEVLQVCGDIIRKACYHSCVYKIMYPEYNVETRNLSESMHKFGSICIWSTTYGSKMQPRGIRSSKIMASWPNNDGQVLQDSFCLSAGSVQYYFKHPVQLEDQFHQHCFACVIWYIPHAESLSLYGNPIKV